MSEKNELYEAALKDFLSPREPRPKEPRPDDIPGEHEIHVLWRTEETISFRPDLSSGCIFSPEYAEIQRRNRRKW